MMRSPRFPWTSSCACLGEVFDPQSDEEARTLALVYLEEKHADALRAMDAMEWLDIDRVAVRLLGREGRIFGRSGST